MSLGIRNLHLVTYTYLGAGLQPRLAACLITEMERQGSQHGRAGEMDFCRWMLDNEDGDTGKARTGYYGRVREIDR
jgi:hypothetical protein